jgi:outer membrane receptor protein involved in Fe transport
MTMFRQCLNRRVPGAFTFLLLLASAAIPGWSQAVSARLLGTVTDATGAVVPSANLTIRETQTGVSRNVQTNESGNWTVPDLPPGIYEVDVEAKGFKKEVRRDITLLVDTTTRVDVQLQPGAVTDTVEVTGAPPLLQTDTASTGEKIEREVLANVPLISSNRNFQSLLNLAPGVAPVQEQHSQFFNAGSSLQTEVNGQMRMGNNFMIDGTDDNERTGLLQIYIPPIEAIQTVDVSLTNHDPELGRASGGVMNVVIKSGTNQIHGAAYEFLQNSDFNARSFFNPSVGHLAYNYVGGNIGAPIKKNKVFVFGDYLRVMDHEANTNNVEIPPDAWRTGNFSSVTNSVIYDPNTGNPVDGTGRQPFAGNMIPATEINPISTKILSYIPGTNESYNINKIGNNYFALLPYQKTTDSFDVKVDDNFTDTNRLSARFSFSRPVVFQAPLFGIAGGDGPGGAFMGTGLQRTYSGGLNYDRIFSPTLVANVRVGVSYYNNVAQPSDYGQNDSTALGIPGVNISPFTSGFVSTSLGDGISSPLTGYSASLPWVRSEANVDLVNTWTKTMRNHTFKWGVDFKRVRDNLLQDQTYGARGIYDFGNEQTALCIPAKTSSSGAVTSCNSASPLGVWNDVASFLLDVPYSLGRDVNTYFPGLRASEFFAFGGDTWQVSSKLTVNLGLRWEFYPPATPPFPGLFSNYDPSTNDLVVAGVGGNPSNLGMKTRYTYFAPRAGLAYRLTEKTVIRAGFGTSYTPFPDNTYAYNYPERSNNNYNNVGDGYAVALLPNGMPATFQQGFPAPVPVAVPTNGILPATGSLISQSMFTINKNFKNPYSEAWNFAIQQALPLKLVLDVAYVGLHGVDTVGQYNLNTTTNPAQLGLGTASQPLYAAYGKTAGDTLYWPGFSSSYNALQVKLDRHMANFNITTAFNYGKGMDYQSSDDGGYDFYVGFQRNYARDDWDRTLSFVQSYVYQTPFGVGQRWLNHGPAAVILGNWQIAGVLSLMTGTPIGTVGASGSSLNTPGETQTANQVGPLEILHGINVGNPWFNTSSFKQPTGAGIFGSTGRNPFTGPGLFSLNLSLTKNFRFSERLNLELRAESFNVTNTPEFANPSTSITSSTYGYVNSTIGSGTGVNGTGGGRAIQLGVKLSF